MNVYLAARYGRRAEMFAFAQWLEAQGIHVVSTWIDGHHEVRPNVELDATPEEMGMWAAEDLHDLQRADALVFFSELPDAPGRGRGGRHVEFGVALQRRIPIYVVGGAENVFHHLGTGRIFQPIGEPYVRHIVSKEALAILLTGKPITVPPDEALA